MQEFTLRKGCKEDAAQIARLIMQAMSEECCRYFYGDNHTAADFHLLLTELAGRTGTQYSYENTICATDTDGKIIGISVSYDGAQLHLLRQAFIDGAMKAFGRDFSDMDDETQAGELYLDSLAVLPEYQHRGIATALLYATAEKAEAMGVGPLGLLVDEGNPHAEVLYNKVGFRYAGDNNWGGHRMRHLQKQPSHKQNATKPQWND